MPKINGVELVKVVPRNPRPAKINKIECDCWVKLNRCIYCKHWRDYPNFVKNRTPKGISNMCLDCSKLHTLYRRKALDRFRLRKKLAEIPKRAINQMLDEDPSLLTAMASVNPRLYKTCLEEQRALVKQELEKTVLLARQRELQAKKLMQENPNFSAKRRDQSNA